MDVLYIPQLDEASGEETGAGASRYRLLRRMPETNRVLITDQSVTRVEVATSEPLTLVLPPQVKGSVRDFFVRIVITADEVPEISFVAPAGETVSYEDVDEDVFKCEIGVNVFAFTETDAGIFIVNRKMVDIDWTVAFDPCGGVLNMTEKTFKLGAQYSSLPAPTMQGYVFQGWFTEPEGGVLVQPTDRVKTGVQKLYAQWAVYVDPFVDYICPAKNLTFHSTDSQAWFIDESVSSDSGTSGCARSGRIGDNGSTTLKTDVVGSGRISFDMLVSSEDSYDVVRFYIDGSEKTQMSGGRSWQSFGFDVSGDGTHEIKWVYSKDGSVSNGSDCAWVDNVVWTPESGG